MSIVKSERLEGVEYWSNPEWPIELIDVVRDNKRVGYISQSLTGLWESRLQDPLEFLSTWTTLELAKFEVETVLVARDEQKRQQRLKAEREAESQLNLELIIAPLLALIGAFAAIAAWAAIIKYWPK